MREIRYASRLLRRSPGFTVAVAATLALGIGLTTAVFSVVRAVLLKPLPYPAAERLVWMGESTARAQGISVTWVNYQRWRESNRSFEDMAAFQYTDRTLTGRGEAVVTHGIMVTYPYFGLLSMRPLMGRYFGPEDDRTGAAPVVVLNHRFWSGSLGGDPKIVGANLTLNGKLYQVIGVAAPIWEVRTSDFYVPLGQVSGAITSRAAHGSIRALGRLRADVTLRAGLADLDGVMQRLAVVDSGPENEHRAYGEFWTEHTNGSIRGVLLVLMAAAGLVLLIACANVAGLQVARNIARTGELAVRIAMGAGRLRLARELLAENALVSIVGGAAGILLAAGGLQLLLNVAPREIPRLAETRLDGTVLWFGVAVTLLTGLLAGLAPVLSAGRFDLHIALKDSARTAGGGRRRQVLRNSLVVAQVALTFVLAFGAGLLLRSLAAAQNTNPSFDPRGVLALDLSLPPTPYSTNDAVDEFYTRLTADLRALPGVRAVGTVACPPGASSCGDWFYSVVGRPNPPQNEAPIALFNTADASYFAAMGVGMREGRDFNGADRAAGLKVAIVNETLARTWWPHESAVGHQIKVGGPYVEGDVLQIAGVAADVKREGLDSRPMPEIFTPFSQDPKRAMSILIRTAGQPANLLGAVRTRLAALDPNLPIQRAGSLEERLGDGLARRRFGALLLALFAALAMALACVGIYGLLSYWVSVRGSEIAIRLALGARPAGIVRWTGLHALRLAGVGVVLGAIGAWLTSRSLESLVFGIPVRSVTAFAAAGLAIAALALIAVAPPAWRAARTDAARMLHGS